MSNYASSGGPEYLEGPGLNDEDFGRVPKWPKVVGIISIIVGTIMLGCVGCGFAGPALQGMGAAQMKGGMPPSLLSLSIGGYITLFAGAAIDLLLIVGGIMLIVRQYAARAMHLVYGVLALINWAFAMYVQLDISEQAKEWVKQNPDSDYAKQAAAMGNIGDIIGLAIAVIVFLPHPIFCLIWFGLVKKTRDSMTGGVEAAA
jgi:hypothetical protein